MSPAPPIPSALDDLDRLRGAMRGRSAAFFLDYDGTLAPIAERPDLAVLPDETREALRELAGRYPVTVVSGRAREDVAGLVGLDELHYAGSHGFDIAGPEGGAHFRAAEDLVPVVEETARELRDAVAGVPGAIVESKRYAVSVHYRLVAPADVGRLEKAVDRALSSRPVLRKAGGKMLFEIRPALDWDKGKAVLWLLDALDLDLARHAPVYLGDDLTDEDAFKALASVGVAILVSESDRPTEARWRLRDPSEVLRFIRLAAAGALDRAGHAGRPPHVVEQE